MELIDVRRLTGASLALERPELGGIAATAATTFKLFQPRQILAAFGVLLAERRDQVLNRQAQGLEVHAPRRWRGKTAAIPVPRWWASRRFRGKHERCAPGNKQDPCRKSAHPRRAPVGARIATPPHLVES